MRAANFVCEDSVEYRVREVLEEKLAIILDEFGIDKAGDVLDSAQAGQMFDDLYVEAILHPEALGACPRISARGSLTPELACRSRAQMGRCL